MLGKKTIKLNQRKCFVTDRTFFEWSCVALTISLTRAFSQLG